MNSLDLTTFWLVGTVLALLSLAALVGQMLKRQTDLGLNRASVEQFNLRIRSWLVLCAALSAAFFIGRLGAGELATVVLFGLLSFWALREYITLTPTRLADHRALFWVFFVFTPLQYVLVALDQYYRYSVVIPVYAFLFIPARIALAGDYKRYLERCAKIQAGLMICVYCLSFAPALLYMPLKSGYEANSRLLFFFLLVVACGDAFQHGMDRLIGRHLIAPGVSQHKTWEGFLAGTGLATLFGALMYWATPFNLLEAAWMALLSTTVGYAGGLTMSAIKRDRGVKDYGTLVVGHGGVLDRIDSICFAAPVFYHFTRFLVGQDWPGQ